MQSNETGKKAGWEIKSNGALQPTAPTARANKCKMETKAKLLIQIRQWLFPITKRVGRKRVSFDTQDKKNASLGAGNTRKNILLEFKWTCFERGETKQRTVSLFFKNEVLECFGVKKYLLILEIM